jgi:hypothetical protein
MIESNVAGMEAENPKCVVGCVAGFEANSPVARLATATQIFNIKKPSSTEAKEGNKKKSYLIMPLR